MCWLVGEINTIWRRSSSIHHFVTHYIRYLRVQKSALRIILGKRYTSYNDALRLLNIESLEDRRKSLCLKFAKNCLKVDKLRKIFPKSTSVHGMSKRNVESFIVNRTLTERYLNSAVLQMQRMLNCYQKKQNETLRQLGKPSKNKTTNVTNRGGRGEIHLSQNKTKYFCSDSMMKYALREGLERAKKVLRKG